MNQTVSGAQPGGFLKSTATPQTDAKTRTGSSVTQSFAQGSSTNQTTMTATHSSEVMTNLNPVTKKYLQQIEKAY